MSMQLIYGTGNPAKIQSMKRNVQGMPLEVIGLLKGRKSYCLKLKKMVTRL